MAAEETLELAKAKAEREKVEEDTLVTTAEAILKNARVRAKLEAVEAKVAEAEEKAKTKAKASEVENPETETTTTEDKAKKKEEDKGEEDSFDDNSKLETASVILENYVRSKPQSTAAATTTAATEAGNQGRAATGKGSQGQKESEYQTGDDNESTMTNSITPSLQSCQTILDEYEAARKAEEHAVKKRKDKVMERSRKRRENYQQQKQQEVEEISCRQHAKSIASAIVVVIVVFSLLGIIIYQNKRNRGLCVRIYGFCCSSPVSNINANHHTILFPFQNEKKQRKQQ